MEGAGEEVEGGEEEEDEGRGEGGVYLADCLAGRIPLVPDSVTVFVPRIIGS